MGAKAKGKWGGFGKSHGKGWGWAPWSTVENGDSTNCDPDRQAHTDHFKVQTDGHQDTAKVNSTIPSMQAPVETVSPDNTVDPPLEHSAVNPPAVPDPPADNDTNVVPAETAVAGDTSTDAETLIAMGLVTNLTSARELLEAFNGDVSKVVAVLTS